MGFVGFLGRNIGAAVIGGGGIILAGLGYADQAQQIATGFHPWALQALGASLFVVSVVMVLYGYDQAHSEAGPKEKAKESFPSLPTTKAAPHVLPPSPAPIQPASTPKRVYLSGTVTPDDLMEKCKGKTRHQAQLAMKPFIGKWLRVEGVFDDLSIGDHFATLSLRRKEAVFGNISVPDTRLVIYQFENGFERLEVLEVGERIVLDGKIKEVDSFIFKLTNCELVEVGGTSRAAPPPA